VCVVTRASTIERPVDRLTEIEIGAWRGLLRVHASLLKALETELEEKHGVPLTSYEVLMHLSEAPDGKLRMSALAERVLLSRSGLTRLIDRLVAEGLIERLACDDDARGSYALLTPAGNELVARAKPSHLAMVRERFLRHFSEDELTELAERWARLV
jgi:DNA-binding MarR family transcriptional regulator